jgi:aspartate aminotransferase-like enzyme
VSAPDVAAAEPCAEELLRITLAVLNARPMFRVGHVGDRTAIRDSYQLASAIERCLERIGSGEAP